MYKVKEAADALGVSRVEIFEILLSQRELFEPYVEKNNSITYISESGLDLLRQSLESGLKRQEKEPEPIVADEPSAPPIDGTLLEDLLESGLEEGAFSEVQLQEDAEILRIKPGLGSSPMPAVDIEASDDVIGQWLKEIQEEDLEADQQDARLKELRTQVTQLRNKILSLDSEIKRKDEAIKHYHEIMKDDVRWLEDLERKTQLMVKHELMSMGAGAQELSDEEEDKGNFFKFFKR